MQIVPGILTNDINKLETQVRLAVGLVPWVQIDFIDGVYADNWTIRPIEISNIIRQLADQISKIKGKNLRFEAHLMLTSQNLDEWLVEAKNAGFERIVAQVEGIRDQVDFIKLVKKEWGLECGLSLDAQTPVEIIAPSLLKRGMGGVDVIQVMTIQAGFQRQQFQPELLAKVKELNNLKVRIQVDGGVKIENIELVAEAGADSAIVGSGLYGLTSSRKGGTTEGQGDFAKNLQRFKSVLSL